VIELRVPIAQAGDEDVALWEKALQLMSRLGGHLHDSDAVSPNAEGQSERQNGCSLGRSLRLEPPVELVFM
jgi:hypothetical protein